MPNAKVLSEKQAMVAELTERIKGASAGVIVDYEGINVANDTALRAEMRKDGVTYSVNKNTLMKRAFEAAGLDIDSSVLEGASSLATTDGDPIAPFRIISDYSKKLGDCFKIKSAFMDGKVLDETQVAELAALPSKDALYSKVLGTMIAPITGLAVCLGQILEQKGGSLGDAAAEAAE